MKKIFCFAIIVILVSSCVDWRTLPAVEPPPPVKVWGYVPVYSIDPTVYNIYADTPRPMKYPGKIYVKDNLIFQNDNGYGIHIIDKTNPSDLKRIGFINLRGNLEMSIRGNFLYANSYNDLVVVDITNWRAPKEIQRVERAFSKGSEARHELTPYTFIPLPEKNVYFECVNLYSGALIGWKRDSVLNNNCYYH